MKKGSLLFLGTGGSMGTPVIACTCAVCLSTDSRNKRLRSSALLKLEERCFLIDVGPDFRAQALSYQIQRIDALLLTHTHFDHTAGLDELRVFSFLQHKTLPCLLSEESLSDIHLRFPYFFQGKETARFDFHPLKEDFGSVNFEGISWDYVSFFQNGMKVTGWKIGNLAYILDIKDFSAQVIEEIRGVEILVVSALKSSSSKSHFSLEEAIAFSKKVGASQTYFSHIAHDIDHEKTNNHLPDGVFLAYDGLEVSFDY